MLGTPAFQSTLPLGKQKVASNEENLDDGEYESQDESDIGDYSIDLGKFGEAGVEELPRHQRLQRPRELSEVGGPEDFTLHLRDYINGVLPLKKDTKNEHVDKEGTKESAPSTKEPNVDNDHKKLSSQKKNTEAPEILSITGKQYSHNNMNSLSAKETNVLQPSQSAMPPITRNNTEGRLDEAADEIFERITALQAEIEKLRLEGEASKESNQALQDQCSTFREERSSLRSEVTEVRTQVEEAKTREARAHERVMALERERSSNDAAELNALKAKNESLVSELATAKTEVRLLKESFHDRMLDLKSEPNKVKEHPKPHPEDGELLAPDVAKLKEDLANANKTIAQLESFNAMLQSIADAARHESTATETQIQAQQDRFMQEIEELDAENRDLTNTLKIKGEELSAAQASIQELQKKVHSSSDQTSSPPTSRFRELQEEAVAQADAEHGDTMRVMEKKHAAEVKVLKSQVLKVGRGMQKREARLAEQKSRDISILENEIAGLRSQISQYEADTEAQSKRQSADHLTTYDDVNPPIRDAGDSTAQLRSANSHLRKSASKLCYENERMRHERDEALRELVMKREDYQAVNKDLDERLLGLMRERDAKWKSKIHKLKEENTLMGKTLLMMWGREECGAGAKASEGAGGGEEMMNKQRYLYKYRQKSEAPAP